MNNRKLAALQGNLPSSWSDLTISCVQPDICDNIFEVHDGTRFFVRINDLRPDARGKRADLRDFIKMANTVLVGSCPSINDPWSAGHVIVPRALVDRCEAVLDDAFDRGGVVVLVYTGEERLSFWRTTIRAFATPETVVQIVDPHGVGNMREGA